MRLSAWCAVIKNGLIFSSVCMALAGCGETAPPPHMARDLGTKDQPLLPLNSPWTDRAIREGQAEWVPFRSPGEARKSAKTEGGKEAQPEATKEDAAGSADAAVTGLIAEYNNAASESNVDEIVKYFVESQEEQLRVAYENLGTAREAAKTLKDRLLQQDGADADGINAAFEKMDRFTSGLLQAKETHAHEDKKVHITFETGSFLAGGHALVDGKDWYLEAAALPDTEGIKIALSPFTEQIQKLGADEPVAADVLAALLTMKLPILGTADEPASTPEGLPAEAEDAAGAEKETE